MPRAFSTVRHCWAVAIVSLFLGGRGDANDETPINLLRSRAASVTETSLRGAEKDQLPRLADGRPATIAEVPVTAEVPVDIVYGFGEQIVAVEQLALLFPPSESNAAVAKIEILVSTLSPNAGFHSLREQSIRPSRDAQTFDLPSTAAKWIMIRLFVTGDAQQIEIAELAVNGRFGAPQTRYAFDQSPANALQLLAKLKSTVSSSITVDEEALFADARDGKLDEHSFAEAALIASGVTDKSQRDEYLREIDELESKARRAVASETSAFQRGQKLLKWLHEHPLAGGYTLRQTDLDGVLDTGKFNCVSSATLYNIIGRRLGLDTRAIEVPDHAFSILYDGARHVDVETTTRHGFDPSGNTAARRQFEEQTGFEYVDERCRELRREVGDQGITAIIYYNRGVDRGREKKFLESLVAYFCALSLDPEFDSSIKNALAVLANWGIALAKSGDFERALDVIGIGLALAPEDATLVNNRKATWGQWIEKEVEDGRSEEALALIGRATQAVPDGNFAAMQSWVYIGPGEKLVKQKQWQGAFDLATTALTKQLSPAAKDELKSWRRSVIGRWWDSELEAGQFAQAALVLERGLKLDPHEKRYTHNLGYLVQEWLEHVDKQNGADQAEAILGACLRRFPQVESVKRACVSYFHRKVVELQKNNEHQKALQTTQRAIEKFPQEEDVQGWLLATYAAWAHELQEKKQWEAALKVYDQAKGRFPEEARLKDSQLSVFDHWMDDHAERGEWAQAIKVYERALKQFPESSHVHKNFLYLTQQQTFAILKAEGEEAAEKSLAAILKKHPNIPDLKRVTLIYVQHQVDALQKAGKEDAALALIQRCAATFQDEEQIPKEAQRILGRRMDKLLEAKRWSEAVKIGNAGRKQFPGERYFQNNVKFAYSKWANELYEAKKWDDAIKVLEEATEKYPQERIFKQNLQLAKEARKGGEE